MQTIRIFISSPSDVYQERMTAKKVIAELNKTFQQHANIEALLWEDMPLLANASFQEGIDAIVGKYKIDLAVFILWTRLGSPLGKGYRKPDGTLYQSGTEYEYDMMMTSFKEKGSPKILAYVKDEPLSKRVALLGSDTQIQETVQQHAALKSFIKEHFYDEGSGSHYAYTQFGGDVSFEARLKSHLTNLILGLLGENVSLSKWNGNPYVGLKSYERKDTEVYFGHEKTKTEIMETVLSQIAEGKSPSVILLGESGSGKSSLVQAGLIPLLDYVEGHKFVTHKIVPSLLGEQLYDGFVELFLSLYPEIAMTPVSDELRAGIKTDYNFAHLKFALQHTQTKQQPVLFFDQFEEVFSNTTIPEEQRILFLRLMKGLVDTKRVFVILSMRNDFYPAFTNYKDFGMLKDNVSKVYDIPRMGPMEYSLIVKEPTKLAGVEWEINQHGQSLQDIVVNHAIKLGHLPLIQFALYELYNKRSENNCITFASYDAIGGLKGAFLSFVNDFYAHLTNEEQTAFKDVLSRTLTISYVNTECVVRKTALMSDLTLSNTHRTLLKKLVDAHIFVSDRNAQGEATITLAHEMLIESWPVVKDWCEQQSSFLHQNEHYEKLANHWTSNRCPKTELIQERSLLLEAEFFMYKHEKNMLPMTKDFLCESLRRQRRQGLIKHIFGLVFVCLFFISAIFVSILGTTGDITMDDYIGIGNMTPLNITRLYLPLLIVSFLAVFLRFKSLPKYKTIKKTLTCWVGVLLFVYIDTGYDFFSEKTDWYICIIYVFVYTFTFGSVYLEYQRRKLWERDIYKPYAIADKYDSTKKVILYTLVYCMVLFLVLLYAVILSEKNDQINEQNNQINHLLTTYADPLYEGLNNMCSQMSWSDRKTVNDLRMNYINDRYSDDLSDEIPDIREYEYAQCLYNLFQPKASLSWLYLSESDEPNCLLGILNNARLGNYDMAAELIEEYIAKGYFSESNWAGTKNLIWIAEEAGRFDLAEDLFNLIEENGINWRVESGSFWVNYGHILLMRGELEAAKQCYIRASNVDYNNNPTISNKIVEDLYDESVRNDFRLFNWLEVGNATMVESMSKLQKYPVSQFYTHVSDSLETNAYRERMAGQWLLAPDTAVVMTYDADVPICQYKVFVGNEEINRCMTTYRVSKRSGHLYIEEYDRESGIISQGEIFIADNTHIKIKIIDNGNEKEKGTVRTYIKSKE